MKKLIATTVLAGSVLALASPANAFLDNHRIVTEVAWKGPQCIPAWVASAADPYRVISIDLCGQQTANGAWFTRYVEVQSQPGAWIGADPEIGSATELGCSLFVDGRWHLGDHAYRGDGHDATCLETL